MKPWLSKDRELQYKELKIDQLTHEMAVLKRWKFAARSEQLHGVQRSLLDETIDADLEAIAAELAALRSPNAAAAEGAAQASLAAGALAAGGSASRAGTNDLRLRLRDEAHRRGREREARLHPGRVPRRAAHSWQVGVYASARR